MPNISFSVAIENTQNRVVYKEKKFCFDSVLEAGKVSVSSSF